LAELESQYDVNRQDKRTDRALLDALGAERFAELCAAGQLVRQGRYQREVLVRELGQAYWTRELGGKPPAPWDDRLWAAIIAVVTSGLLVAGRYGLIQSVSTVLVCGFTLTTVINLAMLQMQPSWAVTFGDVVNGLSFRLPPHSHTALATAMATFGIIGVGATEIVFYPYWCLEKGYARFTGPRDESPAWAERARGWMRVLSWDAWCSMVLYTFATIAFYLLGAATLGRTGLNPASSDMIRTLQVMYEPVFNESAWIVFLVGAFAVLYSTFFVANASHARVFSDTIAVLGLVSKTESAQRRRVVFFSGLFPLLCLVMYVFFPQPARLVLISGVMQAFMLPMLAIAGLYFRYRRSDPRLEPGKLWDACLWLSAVGMFVAGIWAVVSQF
jgi:Mn2+/Fe2+ NRAMP family transporter